MLRYAISEGNLSHTDDADAQRLIARAAELARTGVDFILLREKHLNAAQLTSLTRCVVALNRETATRIIVPGRADIALAGGAAGVHLSSAPGELTPHQVRTVFSKAWISVSCHSIDEVIRAHHNGADAILLAPVFGKTVGGVEVVPGLGLDLLRQACRAAGQTPVLALGGVSTHTAPSCLDAGAAGIAGIRMFFGEGHSPI